MFTVYFRSKIFQHRKPHIRIFPMCRLNPEFLLVKATIGKMAAVLYIIQYIKSAKSGVLYGINMKAENVHKIFEFYEIFYLSRILNQILTKIKHILPFRPLFTLNLNIYRLYFKNRKFKNIWPYKRIDKIKVDFNILFCWDFWAIFVTNLIVKWVFRYMFCTKPNFVICLEVYGAIVYV